MSQDEKKSSSIALVQSVDLDDTRPQTDPKHYRLIQLSNGLQVMLISDPRAPSGPYVCASCAVKHLLQPRAHVHIVCSTILMCSRW